MKKNPVSQIQASNIEEFIKLAIIVASLRQNPNDFLRTEANIARITWAKKQEAWIRQLLNMIIRSHDPHSFMLQTYENMRVGDGKNGS